MEKKSEIKLDNPQVIISAAVKRPTNGSQKPISNAVKEIVGNISKYYFFGRKNQKSNDEI